MKKKHFDFDHIEVSLTPLIDTLLVLILVFIVCFPFVQYNVSKINLPTTNCNDAITERNDLVFCINQYGKIISHDRALISRETVMQLCKDYIKKNPNGAVILFIDKDLFIGEAFIIIDDIKNMGIKNVYIKTKKNSPLY